MKSIITTLAIACLAATMTAQEELVLTLNQTIERAQQESPSAISARHTLRSYYWTYRNYKAGYKPEVSLTASPTFNRGINQVVQPDGTSNFVHVSQLNSDMTLSVSQSLPFTGGTFFINSSLYRYDQIEGVGSTAFSSTPISVGYQQSLLGYNQMKWDRRTEPLRWQEAQKRYNETMELVASNASSLFFSLAYAQTDVDIAKSNLMSADTLCFYAEGRYNIGTISENEMLQLQLNKLNEENNLLDANVNLDVAAEALRNFLNLPVTTKIRVVTDGKLPLNNELKPLEIPLGEALEFALQNNPDPDYYRRSQIESRENLAYTKASTGLKADLYLKFGLSQTGMNLSDAYRNPSDMQYASVTVSIPILDWGKGKGRRRVAQSQVALADVNAEQGMKSFQQNVAKMVQQFNLQSRRVSVALEADKTAERRYEVARRLYVMGKNTILDLNSAISAKDSARRSYISSLSAYWSLYYGLRSLTGYDFAMGLPISWPLPDKL